VCGGDGFGAGSYRPRGVRSTSGPLRVPEHIDYQSTKSMTVSSEMFVLKMRQSDHHAVVTD
jgi:hypothetical protein